MKEIKDISELDAGSHYHLFEKERVYRSDYAGLIELSGGGTDFPYFRVRGSNFWTHEGNNQGMERWHIFGPIEPFNPTIEEIRSQCVDIDDHKYCKGKNCKAVHGRGHSDDCLDEHDKAIHCGAVSNNTEEDCCDHGESINGYCQPCGRINGG